MQNPKFWYPKNSYYISFWAYILWPISMIIYLISRIRFIFKPAYTGKTPIICIGNATVGGTGKTPTAIFIAQLVKSMGYKAAFLTKGYGGNIVGPYKVQESDEAINTGDEALILNIYAPAFIARHRVQGACYIDNLKEFDVIITDDGLQNHPSIYQKCALLTIDKSRLFGNQFLIPAGPLREPVQSALNKAHLTLLIGTDHKATHKNTALDLGNHRAPIITAYKKPISHAANLEGETVIAFSGLGNNQQFFNTIESLGATIIDTQSFPDHYQYNDRIVQRLIDTAQEKAALLVTTEKDMVKINPKFYPFIIPILIEIEVSNGDKETICEKIRSLINK